MIHPVARFRSVAVVDIQYFFTLQFRLVNPKSVCAFEGLISMQGWNDIFLYRLVSQITKQEQGKLPTLWRK